MRLYVREDRLGSPDHGAKITDPDRIRAIDRAVTEAVPDSSEVVAERT